MKKNLKESVWAVNKHARGPKSCFYSDIFRVFFLSIVNKTEGSGNSERKTSESPVEIRDTDDNRL